jgi:nucleoside 2-deoxyribosyltransferase
LAIRNLILMNDARLCLFCRMPANRSGTEVFRGKYDCDRCGTYEISQILALALGSPGAPDQIENAYLISGHTREQFDKAQYDLGNVNACPQFLLPEDFARIAAIAPRTIPERASKLLQAVDRRTKFFGETVTLKVATDYPLAFARNTNELVRLAKFIRDQEWVGLNVDAHTADFTLTAAGFAELEGRVRSNADSETAFVAMSFHNDLFPAWQDGIEPAVRAAGFRPIRIDIEDHNDDINDRIKAETRRARFAVADFTFHRNGVYFEAGFALGLGLPVIWLCRTDEKGKSHFDTEHYNHIYWHTPADIRKRLEERIVGTIGVGPLKSGTTRPS